MPDVTLHLRYEAAFEEPVVDNIAERHQIVTAIKVGAWDRPIWNWPIILNQLAIRFEGRMPL